MGDFITMAEEVDEAEAGVIVVSLFTCPLLSVF